MHEEGRDGETHKERRGRRNAQGKGGAEKRTIIGTDGWTDGRTDRQTEVHIEVVPPKKIIRNIGVRVFKLTS